MERFGIATVASGRSFAFLPRTAGRFGGVLTRTSSSGALGALAVSSWAGRTGLRRRRKLRGLCRRVALLLPPTKFRAFG